ITMSSSSTGATTHKLKDVLTTGEVAKICNVAPRTVSKWFDSGALHGYRIPGSKDRRIPLNQLIRFMKQHGMPLNGLMTGQTRILIVDGEQDIVEVLEKIPADAVPRPAGHRSHRGRDGGCVLNRFSKSDGRRGRSGGTAPFSCACNRRASSPFGTGTASKLAGYTKNCLADVNVVAASCPL